MKIVDFLLRQKELLSVFQINKEVKLKDIDIRHYEFFSDQNNDKTDQIKENADFHYPVFVPSGKNRFDSCIVLMHGLNERSWSKYLYWAEYLALNTGKPVILFPIAFHMNRSPLSWSDPRAMINLVQQRNSALSENKSLCFANAALSERLSENPDRFYNSGHQTLVDLTKLCVEIKEGKHDLFNKGTNIDFFAYSIGAFVTEILFIANPSNLFIDSKLFVFCGGSIFKSMYGESKCIMDKSAYNKIFNRYCYEWLEDVESRISKGLLKPDSFLNAFNMMIDPDKYKNERLGFFESMKNRISGVSLTKDRVMPYKGVQECMGERLADKCFELIDFPYDYTHESPFPVNGKTDETALSDSFLRVFQKAACFLF